jgi:phosphatidylinositol alpha-mannosyltransferase
MKIALVSPYDFAYPGGVTNHIANLAHQLIEMGHQVSILTPLSNTRVKDLREYMVPLGRPIAIRTGDSIARISISAWLAPRLRNLLNKGDFDIVHLHEPLAPLVPLGVLYLSNAVNVGTFHAYHGSQRWYRILYPILKPAFNKLHGRIVVSDAARQMNDRVFPATYDVIPNGIDLPHFVNASPMEEFADEKTNIVFVGRKDKRKGLQYLVEAFSHLKWGFPNIRLIVVGPGRMPLRLQRFIKKNKVKDIVFTGSVSYDDLPRYYHSADIFCAPNTGKESFGIVLLEAMAANKPIVATDIDGFRCVMSQGEQGILVPPRDSRALADALTILIRNPALRERMGNRGRRDVEQYDWKQVATRLVDYYNALLEQHGSSPS